MFWQVVQTHTTYVPDEPAMTHRLGRRVQNLENTIFISGFPSLKVTSAIKHGNTAEEIIIYAHRVYSLVLKLEKNEA